MRLSSRAFPTLCFLRFAVVVVTRCLASSVFEQAAQMSSLLIAGIVIAFYYSPVVVSFEFLGFA